MILYLNKNWYIFKKRKGIYYLFNLATFETLQIKFSDNDQKERLFLWIIELLKDRSISAKNLFNIIKCQYSDVSKESFDIVLNQLLKLRILTQRYSYKSLKLSSSYLKGLERQIECFNELFPEVGGLYIQSKLKKIKLCVIGLGIVGQYVILPLIGAGIGNFILVDFDKVEDRNIGRQPMLDIGDIGKLKTKAISDCIKRRRHGVSVKIFNLMLKNVDDIKRVIKSSDLVIQAADYPRFLIRRWINEACLALKKPNLVVYSGKIGPFCIPYQTSCFGCYEAFIQKRYPFYFQLTEAMYKEGMRRYPEISVVPAVSGIIAAKEAISFILGKQPETINAFFTIDNNTLAINRIKLPRQNNCYACSK